MQSRARARLGRLLWAGLTAGLVLAGCGRAEPPAEDPVKEAQAFRASHEESYRRNWATIAGLHFLAPGEQRAGSAASNQIVLPASVPPELGTFTLTNDVVRFAPAPRVAVQFNGVPLTATVVLRDDGGDEVDELSFGTVKMVIHRSGPKKAVRVWDPDGPLAKGFLGFRWFDIQPAYRVTARFIRDAQPREVRVVNTYGDPDTYQTEGVVEFTLGGRQLRMRPFTTRPKRFYFVFKDASSGEETYGAARFLYADLRDDGTVVLDFNQAYNPPCSFNPFTTCPIPLPENRLPVKVLAGERAYPVEVPLPGASS